MKRFITYLFLFLTFFPLVKISWEKKDYYSAPFDLELAKKAYGISQYVRGKDAAWIADEVLYAYAGWYYINGGSPILVNPEIPPLVKYITGASIKFFNNEKIPSLIFSFLSIFSIFLLTKIFLKSTYLALLPAGLFSWGKLFQEQLLFIPLLETFALTFLTLAFYFFIKAQDRKIYFWVASFFLGTLWTTRPWMATVPLVAAWFIYLLLKRDFKILKYWILTLTVAVVVLLLNYWRLFLEGWGIYKILSIQKWILWYHQSRLINFGTVWEFIYLGKWRVWWGDEPYLPVNQWTLIWPILTTLALIFSVIILAKSFGLRKKWVNALKFNAKATVLSFWIVFYLIFLSFGNINSRYVFYLIPYCYILGFYFLVLVVEKVFNRYVSF